MRIAAIVAIIILELGIIGVGVHFYEESERQKVLSEKRMKEQEIRLIDTLNLITKIRESAIRKHIDSISAIKQKTVTRLTKEKNKIHEERISNGNTSSSMPRF